MYNFSQEQVFIFFFIIGIIIGCIFDFFKVLRKSFKYSDIITFIEDIISAFLIITGIIKLNNGEVRFFLFLGIFFGVLVYSLTISNLYVIILYTFVELCKKILKIPFCCLKTVFIQVKSAIKKDF